MGMSYEGINANAIWKVAYRSKRVDAASETLDHIIARSQENNVRDQLTGVLIHDDKSYLQLLEGGHDQIACCFLRIASDERHSNIDLAARSVSSIRLYSNWGMKAWRMSSRQGSVSTLWRRIKTFPATERIAELEQEILRLVG